MVQSLAPIGNGCPDLLVIHKGRVSLLEVKDGNKAPSARALTEPEARWHEKALGVGGTVYVVASPEAALAIVSGQV
jgi:hypothetical protein